MRIARMFKTLSVAVISAAALIGCSSDEPDHNGDIPGGDDTPSPPATTSAFAKGVDMSWLTQMESEGLKFYAPGSTVPTEAMQLLRDTKGIDAMRLRVWVNPADKWNNIDDVLVKARRAHALGLRIMIDFHFSDSWADPLHQTTPAEWADLDLNGLKAKVASHVTELMTKLKNGNITPEWVQIGNEITNGMLHPIGHIDNPANLAALINAGYDAVKAVSPTSKVIVHLDKGEDDWRYSNVFPKLLRNGGKFDIIGMSLYPEDPSDQNPSNWKAVTDKCLSNIRSIHSTYGVPVMICEVGMHYTKGAMAKQWLTYLKDEAQKSGYVDGIFYWEPQAPAGYSNGYFKGCFIDNSPTEALDAFK